MIYTIRTTSGREDTVVDMLMLKVREEGLGVKSVFHPAEFRGYIFAEGTPAEIHRAIKGLMHVKGMIDRPVELSEIQQFLEKSKDRIRVSENDTVEIIGGPFKGERGKIKRIDKAKDDVTVELTEASIPIPVTIATEFVKMIKRAAPEEAAKPAEAPASEETEPKKSIFDEIMESAVKPPEPEPAEEPKPEEKPEKPPKPEKPETKEPEPKEEAPKEEPAKPAEKPPEEKPKKEETKPEPEKKKKPENKKEEGD